MLRRRRIKRKGPIKKRCDSLWSKIIRSHGQCEICGAQGVKLDAHHVIGRGNLNTRYDLENGVCLCSGCHTFNANSAHQNPIFFLDWFKKTYGTERIDFLNAESNKHKSFKINDYIDLEKELKQVLETKT